ncbi:heavy metal translocating P-type ATPase [Thioflexithrix psekupsensis]|uniref:Cation transporter n=1 Tax=Thioflexithrix psekupsensis TaxID=1570016 RepID=A0A251X6C6_9GAMM|nr:heavy metal translocating P-type ATPase [Thioflexithrix psekupsensis]OUD13213.1 cation transporter [Thioflexithrix psekupsensis]
MTSCFHCGLPVPENSDFTVIVDGETQLMCCAGCQAVAQAIVDSGLSSYYRYRTENAPTGRELVPEFLKQTTLYDNPTIQQRFVNEIGEHEREVSLILEGITCAACIWLNERHLRTLPGVREVQMNYATQRAHVRWDSRELQLSRILQAISEIGYLAHPYDPKRQQALLEQERKQQLRRLGLAGVLGLQVMMFAMAVYAGDWSTGIEYEFRQLFNWISLVLTLPILLYSAQPFFKSAVRDLKHGRIGMDVPVSVGLTLAFVGSVWVTFTGQESHVYYDSIAMFTFLLLTGRYFEFLARQRSAHAAETLVQMVPTLTTRLDTNEQGQIQEIEVLVAELQPGDRVLVRPGESIPADGVIITGQSSIDESLLTGESYPITCQPGHPVVAGTINIESPLQMRVEKVGQDTVLSHILRLLTRAQSEKPTLTLVADRVASWFLGGVLLLSIAVAWYWWMDGGQDWLAVTLAVLVVTCPCALSLATPTAITAATSALTQAGLLVTRGTALETLAQATHFIFDKTGTLTAGRLAVQQVHVFSNKTESDCLQFAAALEQHSEHPIAKAILTRAGEYTLTAQSVVNTPGSGLHGEIAGEMWYLGTPSFIAEQTHLSVTDSQALQAGGDTVVVLATGQQVYAAFLLADELREGAAKLIADLYARGHRVSLLTGDHEAAAKRVADAVGITTVQSGLKPDDKLAFVRACQASGEVVAMIGDGVNDAPVLAQAQVSIAMGGGTQVARASADMILLSEQLSLLSKGVVQAKRTLVIVRQNIAWAIGYNVLALPAAVMGYVSPWMAALGMSLSSLLVLLNAMRLLEKRDTKKPTETQKNSLLPTSQ